MSYYSQYIAEESGPFYSNPKLLPFHKGTYSKVLLKRSSVIRDAADPVFWTSMDNFGAVHTITVADTYEELVNISGSGFVGNILSPSFQGQIKITVDDNEYEFISGSTVSDYRIILGFVGIHTPSTTSDNAMGIFGNLSDEGMYADELVNNSTVNSLNTVNILPPMSIKNAGLPMLRFKRNLKVDVYGPTTTANLASSCGITYLLD